MLGLFAALVVVSGSNSFLVLGVSSTLGDSTLPQPVTPIQHIVIIMQENHAFDQFFGVFPGLKSAYALNPSVCDPYNLSSPANGCVHPWNGDNMSNAIQASGLGHSWKESQLGYDKGQMDGFVDAAYSEPLQHSYARYAMSFFTNRTIPNYWDYASYYSLDANFFSSILSYSYPQHLYLVAGQVGNATGVFGGQGGSNFDLKYGTMATQLTAAGVDWKYYAGGWSDSNDCKPTISSMFDGTNGKVSQAYLDWNVLPDFPAVQLNPATCSRLQNTSDLFSDISKSYLPQVAWITSNSSVSDHPGSADPALSPGQVYVAEVINAISSNPTLWKNTAIFLSWDDFGGYSDHVKPVQVDPLGYGFRIPLIVISPYVKHGGLFYGVNKQQEDLGALLNTIEYNWNIPALTNCQAPTSKGLVSVLCRDNPALVYNLFYMFNFLQKPLKPLILPNNALAVYPYSTCISKGLCKTGSGLQPIIVKNAPPIGTLPAYTGPVDQEGDPYD